MKNRKMLLPALLFIALACSLIFPASAMALVPVLIGAVLSGGGLTICRGGDTT